MIDPNPVESVRWVSLLRHSPLGILTDFDGTLVPFASRPEDARPTRETRALLDELAALPGVTLAVVSGRPHQVLGEFFPAPRSMLLVAEHGGWRASEGDWEPAVAVDARPLDALLVELRRLQAKYPQTLVERKTWGAAFHYRLVPEHRKASVLVQLGAIVDPWLLAHAEFERLWGHEVLEIRPRAAKKSNAVRWVRELAGPNARLLIVGDDTTDEDMFAEAAANDVAMVVSADSTRPTKAAWRLESPEAFLALLREIIELRREGIPAPSVRPMAVAAHVPAEGGPYKLLVLSNRLPELRSADASPQARQKNVGGLVSALRPVLEARHGIWLGWSGQTHTEATESDVRIEHAAGLSLASVDFPEEWHRRYYNGFSNTVLWPLFHSFPARVRFAHADWHAYVRANYAFAQVAAKLVTPDATVWVHDYHLLLLAKFLRAAGHMGPIGLFQHIPFPGPDLFSLIPWANEILEAMLEFDLVGFHTQSYVENFGACAAKLAGTHVEPARVVRDGKHTNLGAFPIGIIPEDFQPSAETAASEEIQGFLKSIGKSRLVLGVDRLDYTKGIPERIDAFGWLLELFPEWRKNVCLVQVSVPTRADIPEYAEQRSRVENSVGRINGQFGEADWVPIRYLYRSYGRAELSQLYRAADVGYVTPLRDGMNLVAKEFVAAQDPESPGVLLLSRFAGAAEELRAALLTNPWDPEGTAHDLDRALRMPADERRARHEKLARIVAKTTALTWAEDFLASLGRARA
jgi:trehalose 6-phosphate synthase